MSEKEDQGAPADISNIPESVEYEDDFEKDLEWLTNEELKQNRGERENPEEDEEDMEAQILKAADNFKEDNEEIEENLDQLSEAEINAEVRYSSEENLESRPDTGQEDYAFDTSGESSSQESELESEEELDEVEDEEMKRYILEKIEEANKHLENQAPADKKRARKLKFKDELAEYEVCPPEDAGVCKTDLAGEDDVSSGLSQLHISDDMGQESTSLSTCSGTDEETTDDKILVEKDGKFEFLRLCDLESQDCLPPINVSFTDVETRHESSKSSHYISFPAVSHIKEIPPERSGAHSFTASEEESMYLPKPPSDTKHCSNSAVSAARGLGKQKNPQRTQSANVSVRSSTYSLSPRQKELRKQIEQRNERLQKEEEEKRREQEEQKRRQNEVVFKAWLQKKKEQLQEEKRIRRAKQLEELSIKERNRDPEAAYKLWLKRKDRELMRERQIQLLRRQAEEFAFFPRTEECERAFKEWLRRKREEKRAAELAAKEKIRQLRLEARRARQMQSIQYI